MGSGWSQLTRLARPNHIATRRHASPDVLRRRRLGHRPVEPVEPVEPGVDRVHPVERAGEAIDVTHETMKTIDHQAMLSGCLVEF